MSDMAALRAEKDLSGCRALVIDSDNTSRSVLISQLRDFGVGEVAHFSGVRNARKFLEINKVDFVLCEQNFNDDREYTGQDLLDDLRRAQLLPYSTVFIMVTGEATYAKVAEAAESSLDGYLLKPHKPSVLYERLIQARRRKIYLKPIFDPMDVDDFARAAKVCELFFHKKAAYALFAARMGADLMLRLGQHEQAKQLFEAVLAEKPVLWAKLGVARSQIDSGKPAVAIATVESLIAEDPRFVDAYDVLGRAHVEAGDQAKAIEAYRKACELTPGSISRVQKYGIISFYMGDVKTAHRALSQCVLLGADSKMFDYQSFVLLGFCCLYSKDRKTLARCHEDLGKAVERQPHSERLRRFKAVVAVLGQLIGTQREGVVEALTGLAGELRQPGFDFEAACNMSLLIADALTMGVELPDAEVWIKCIGMRYCRAKALTEQLGSTLLRHQSFQEVIKTCNAEVNALANQSLSLSLKGHHRAAVEALYAHGQASLNAKLIENAYALLQRHCADLDGVEALRAQVVALRDGFGINQAHNVIGRDTVRRGSATVLKAIVPSSLTAAVDVEPAFAD